MQKPNWRRSDGIYLLTLGCMISLFLGIAFELASPGSMIDFKHIYFGSRCIAHHVDPYRQGELNREYIQEGLQPPSEKKARVVFQEIMGWGVYPPTAFVFFLPLALMPFGPAQIAWMALIIGVFGLASLLAWDLGSDFAPRLSSLLVAFVLANNIVVIGVGNPAAIVVSLCVIATWCFVRRRFIWIGAFCLAAAIELKPHDAVWMWAFFFLVGPEYRKRALQSALAALVLGLPSILWVWHIAPAWLPELRSNLLRLQLPGWVNDPHFATAGNYQVGGNITLQSAFSFFRNAPAFYNASTYVICVPLFLLWTWITLRSSFSAAKTWLALAALLPLSMLPVYHRPYDARLLLLTVPACAMLWAEGGKTGRVALGMTLAALTAISDMPWLLLQIIGGRLHLPEGSLAQRILIAVWVLPIPFILLATGAFYLWVYAVRARESFRSNQILDEQPPLLTGVPR